MALLRGSGFQPRFVIRLSSKYRSRLEAAPTNNNRFTFRLNHNPIVAPASE